MFWKALIVITKIGLLTLAAVWIANRPGTMTIQWLGYTVETHIGIFIAAAILMIMFFMFAQHLVTSMMSLGKLHQQKTATKKIIRGYDTLTHGLAAIAAGDTDQALKLSEEARKYLPQENGLSLLLEAQTARISGNRVTAYRCFEQLMEHKDTVFLGLRGVLLTSMEQGNTAKALELARIAQKKHKKQKWVIRTVYGLELAEQQ